MKTLVAYVSLLGLIFTSMLTMAADGGVHFDARSVRSGPWSNAKTWLNQRPPKAGERVQIHSGHRVVYDVESREALRMVHVAGVLTFDRTRDTRLEVGLLKIEAGETTTEDGFNCHDAPAPVTHGSTDGEAALEIGTADDPIPANVTATIRLVYFDGMDAEALPAIVNCGGRWDVHGAPMNRTWVKLGAPASPGERALVLQESVTGWRAGDRIIVTASKETSNLRTFRKSKNGGRGGQTEERIIKAVQGIRLTFEEPLEFVHFGAAETRSEVANLSRNVVIESAAPDGIRGHTMYRRDSRGSISYAEFRHLGKEGLLGKYSIHFHLVRDSMRGSSVIGASIWDSHNRWITIHGTDYMLVRDCVGYQSVGHGFFLEDGTEQYNVLDRNLAVQACAGKRLPKQALPFDPNDGAGFWWANGRNTFTRNVSCENDEYGFRFEIAKRSNFDPVLNIRQPDGSHAATDIRTIPFFRFEDNESHCEGLYSFNFGDDAHPSVRGDRKHPFTVRKLRAWETHYVLRPNVQFFLLDGLTVHHAAYGVYHPDYDAHVYRNIYLDRVDAEPINRGHDDESIQYGSFTYDNLTITNSRVGRDPLIQMACTSPTPGQAGHFRSVTIDHSVAREGKVVDLGGGPRNDKLQNGVAYYFHGYPEQGKMTKVVSARFPALLKESDYQAIPDFTGRDVRACTVKETSFPELLSPVDDLPPATLITSVARADGKLIVKGLSHDNEEIAAVTVNGHPARIISSANGVLDWEAKIEAAEGIIAKASDKAGNVEQTAAEWPVRATLLSAH